MIDLYSDKICDLSQETSALPIETVPAMAYIPFQQWEIPYEAENGFNKGTIFPCLDKPFTGTGGNYK